MDVAAKAFFLTDVNYVAKDILSVGVSTRSRRQNFFTSFCLPAYQTYTDNVGIITEAINRYLLSFA
jgi:hypothetical protein